MPKEVNIMYNKTIESILISSAIEGGMRTIDGNGKNIVENSVDVLFEKAEKSVDDFFNPCISFLESIDNIFGW